MNIKLLVVGKTDVEYVRAGIEEYVKRLKHYANFEIAVIPEAKASRNTPPAIIKEKEGDAILKYIQQADFTVLLDEHGEELRSVDFAQYLQRQMNRGIKTLLFVVGGAYGFGEKVYEAGSHKISLSKMTFNHQMVRLFFVEQLYRAFTILKGEKYHNE